MTMQPIPAMGVNAELWWFEYLRGALYDRTEPYASGVKVDREVPNPRPPRLVVVARDGGNISGVFDRPRIRLDVWSNTQQNADDLARLVTAIALDAPGTNGCVRVAHISGPNSVADPSGSPRRLSLIDATHRVTVLL